MRHIEQNDVTVTGGRMINPDEDDDVCKKYLLVADPSTALPYYRRVDLFCSIGSRLLY